jgi:acyl-CoA thioesterase
MNAGGDGGAGRKAALPLPGLARERIDAFNRSEFAKLLGMEVTEVWDGGARVVMEPQGKGNPNGVAHGGAIFSLADQAFGMAANLGPVPQVAVSAQIEYIAPSAGRLEAVAERVADDGHHSIYRVTICESDRLVAIFSGVGIAVGATPSPGRDRPE